jgi:hypothetical protein
MLPGMLKDMSGNKGRFRKGATMLQPATSSITCSICSASYESETKLRDHQRMSHRGGGAEERPQAAAAVVKPEPAQV